MPRTCYVVGCQTGYKSNDEKVSTFSFPKNEEMQNKWIKAIPRKDFIVSKNAAICAKHFTPDQIITKWTSGVGEQKVVINLKIPKLQKNAIPCLFAGPKYLSNLQKKRKSPTNRVDSKLSETVINKHVLNQETTVFLQSSIIPTIEYFKNMCWEIEGKNTSITFYTVQCNENEVGVFIEKQICLKRDMIVKCKLYDVFVDIQDICPKLKVLTFDELILVINAVNTKQVCKGGPLVKEFDGITVECADIVQNHWRHKKCTFFISSIKTKCMFCDRLRIAFGMKKSRLSAGKSTRLLLSPSKKNQLDTLRNKNHNVVRKQVLRARHKVKLLQNHLNEFKEKLNKLSDTSVENIIIENKLNDSQSTLIREIMLLCLLFNIRSPGAYRFLREQELMPLPCTSTVRKHLSIVKTDCGFDLRFFDLLKKRMFRKPQNQRHGVLLFDEIRLRKGLYVNTRDLSYSGLEDMGGEADVSEKKTDHGLVFFYQGLADNFSQPIAVFASSYSVKGIVLAQLMLKAIALLESSGCFIDGIICDGAATNRKMWTELGISGKLGEVQNYFIHPTQENRKVYVFSDAPHLLKNLRNHLHDKNWWHYIEAFNADVIHTGNARAIPTITILYAAQKYEADLPSSMKYFMENYIHLIKEPSTYIIIDTKETQNTIRPGTIDDSAFITTGETWDSAIQKAELSLKKLQKSIRPAAHQKSKTVLVIVSRYVVK
ncbi:hypothetical protein QTP88_017865 [Uroleucon formosanum]